MFGRRSKNESAATTGDSDEDVTDGVGRTEDGPFELTDLDDDRETLLQGRLDLGSVLVPVPDGGQLQVEMTPAGAPQAVHLMTQHGRITVAAFAAPKSPGQWRDVASELADALRTDSASVSIETGPWGREVLASTVNGDLRFVGVDGYRWMIRGVATGPVGTVDVDSALAKQIRTVIRGTVVDRGTEPHPVRTPLPITLPQALADQLAAAHQQQVAQAQAPATPGPAPTQQAPAPQPDNPQPRRGASGSAMQQLG
ncbi:hypothetical protein GCM10007304_23260 [Rhodococcoides trifolii]|uniref:DUF3710 domain-containing protein n=1 Tax=Rhodococcoides trifolii TaxID=908250 RepID=A0A917FTZ2_9NOCA|nr:DUF3710 domain-containing protein [Rhodococcus trifolii]GGG08525.1 hypothetical protein GCM10007304_23260 [Rhodococcus trifolii]